MRLLLDANLSPRLVEMLSAGGVEAVHVGDLGLLQATDEAILDAARSDQMVVVTTDSDFPMLLVLTSASHPSVVHLRDIAEQPPEQQAALLLANLRSIEADLERGAIASLSPRRLAVRDLPVR
ncbi:MAG TPA: DUF5615 family PIN-like protein [Acidimicrobiales bacterium]|nr:DUF5615 family PIN-like protein [Acidimicrobiales bacterium]